jgi:hypothetical protein
MKLAALLAARLVLTAQKVGGTDDDLVCPRRQRRRDVHREGHIAADVAVDIFAVDEDLGLVVAGADVEDRAAPGSRPVGGQLHGAHIPHALHEVGMRKPGKAALGAERDVDDIGELLGFIELALLAASSGIDLKLPLAVQVDPILARKLRARVFGAWNHVSYSPLKVKNTKSVYAYYTGISRTRKYKIATCLCKICIYFLHKAVNPHPRAQAARGRR